jgi:hypothetical protein
VGACFSPNNNLSLNSLAVVSIEDKIYSDKFQASMDDPQPSEPPVTGLEFYGEYYDPLDHGDGVQRIRLLTIPRLATSRIKLRLETHIFEEAPAYEALSYV